MTGLVVVGLLIGGGIVALHMILTFKAGGFAPRRGGIWTQCPCGHAASWHAVGGDGCRKKEAGSYNSDCYGYCPCPMTLTDVAPLAAALTEGERVSP